MRLQLVHAKMGGLVQDVKKHVLALLMMQKNFLELKNPFHSKAHALDMENVHTKMKHNMRGATKTHIDADQKWQNNVYVIIMVVGTHIHSLEGLVWRVVQGHTLKSVHF
jgi:hypothetical protein